MIAFENKISQLIRTHKSGQKIGITSVCSANPYVIKAAISHAKKNDSILLIEATSNQVDQFGGYTGLTPELFKNSVLTMAHKLNFSPENLILGGDHLGPNRWQKEESGSAVSKAEEQISAYIKAGFCKIRLDAGMKCADDGDINKSLDPVIAAERTAIFCKAAEDAAGLQNSETLPVYIIGTDVPPPGGAKGQDGDMHVTSVKDVGETIRLTEKAFQKYNLAEAWERVIGIVVQPGVEFGDSEVCEYDRNKSNDLIEFIENYPSFVYEAHSTDYQKKESLSQMVPSSLQYLKSDPGLPINSVKQFFPLLSLKESCCQLKKALLYQILSK